MTYIININAPETWPDELCQCLDNNRDFLCNWSITKDSNFCVVNKSLENELNEILFNHCLLGYHCTRLTDFEISDIEKNGMSILTAELLERKINHLVKDGVITSDIAEKLKKTNNLNGIGRKNKICFIFVEPHIDGEDGVGCLLRFWGGESIYRIHSADSEEQRKKIQEILWDIGTPCVIKVAVPISKLNSHALICEQIAEAYRRNYIKPNAEPVTAEGFVRENIPESNIQKVVKCFTTESDGTRCLNDEFGELVKFEKWIGEPLCKHPDIKVACVF